MTGIERLRELGAHYADNDDPVVKMVGHELTSIADQIEREQDATVADSPYDALPPDERDAIAWVREHGGLERVNLERDQLYGVLRETCDLLDVSYFGVWTTDAQSIWRKLDWYKARLGESVPRSYAERRIASRQRQIDESHAALRRRNARIAELERERDDLREMVRQLNAQTDEMEKRLMPEGMEWLVEAWPRFEDDAPVRFLDDFERYGDKNGVSVVTMYSDGSFALNFRAYSKGEHVNRPAPKVLDADGVEIRVGDKPYRVDNGKQVEIRRIDPSNGESCVFVGVDGRSYGYWLRPDQLTHERPDSKCRDCKYWQKDPAADNMGVCWFYYHEHEGQDCYAARLADIGACEEFMPRAGALAGDA